MRSNCDFIFAAREKNPLYRKMLYETFNIGFDDFKTFDDVYKATTTNFDIMVLACALPTPSDLISDNLFFWKAIFPIPSFRVNSNGAWWALHEKKREPRTDGETNLGTNVVKLGRVVHPVAQSQSMNRQPVLLPKLVKKKKRFFSIIT